MYARRDLEYATVQGADADADAHLLRGQLPGTPDCRVLLTAVSVEGRVVSSDLLRLIF